MVSYNHDKNERCPNGMFYGEFVHAVDAKNRIRIPAKFKLPKGEDYVFTVLRDGVISVYSSEVIDKKFAPLTNMSPFDEDVEIAGGCFSNFFSATEDGQGRVMIPEPIRRQVETGSEVVSVGMGDHIDIMTPERRDRMKEAARSPEARKKLNALFNRVNNGN